MSNPVIPISSRAARSFTATKAENPSTDAESIHIIQFVELVASVGVTPAVVTGCAIPVVMVAAVVAGATAPVAVTRGCTGVRPSANVVAV